MGTAWRVVVVGADAPGLQSATGSLLEELEGRFSHWRRDSEISRFNRAPVGVAVPVSAETVHLVHLGEEVRKASRGAFDIRVGSVVAGRGFGPEFLAPENGEAAPLALPEEALEVRSAPPALLKSVSPLAVDLSAYAKGHAVDRLAALLEERGLRNYLVEIGGELRACGTNADREAWTIGLERPDPSRRAIHLRVELNDEAIATSGNYLRFRREQDGRIRSHLVDPRTTNGTGAVFRGVSVIHAETVMADAWATALFVLGEGEGLRLAEREGLAACFFRLTGDGEVVRSMTPSFRRRVRP